MQDQEYKNRCVRELYEAIWKFQGTQAVNFEEELGKLIFNAVEFPTIVSGAIDEEVAKRKENGL